MLGQLPPPPFPLPPPFGILSPPMRVEYSQTHEVRNADSADYRKPHVSPRASARNRRYSPEYTVTDAPGTVSIVTAAPSGGLEM